MSEDTYTYVDCSEMHRVFQMLAKKNPISHHYCEKVEALMQTHAGETNVTADDYKRHLMECEEKYFADFPHMELSLEIGNPNRLNRFATLMFLIR